jgi:transposase
MKPYSLDLRLRVIQAYERREGAMRPLATRFAVSLSFVCALITRYRATGTVAPKPHGGATLPNLMREGAPWSAASSTPIPRPPSKSWARASPPPPRAPSAVPRCAGCGHNSTSRAKKTFRAAEPGRADVQRQRADFLTLMQQLSPDNLLFSDEAGSNLAMPRDYARAPRGQRAYATKPVNRGRHVTMLGALGLDGLVAAMTVEGFTDGNVFLAFLHEVLVPQLRPGHVVILDNLKAHKVAGVAEACAAAGARLLSFPPYSPDLSPIEECWSKVKALLRAKAARTLEALEQAIAEVFTAITVADARGWFTHAGYCSSFN